jgi:hypothetical protein
VIRVRMSREFNRGRRLSLSVAANTSYRTYASFHDPDGGLLQEVTTRLPVTWIRPRRFRVDRRCGCLAEACVGRAWPV